MGIDGYLAICGLMILLVYVVSALVESFKTEKKKGPSRTTHRWKRYRVQPVSLLEGGERRTVLSEDPKGLQLFLHAGAAKHLPIWLGDRDGAVRVRLERGLLSGRVLVVRLGKQVWLKLRSTGDGEFPEIRPAEEVLPKGALDPEKLQLHGNFKEREFEIRYKDCLVASVSWQRKERGSHARSGYYVVEVVRSVEQLPLIALALGLEAVAVLDGVPAR